MGTDGKFCYLEHSILSKISCASKQEEENASNSPGIVSLVLVSMQRSGTIGIQHAAWRGTTRSLVILSGWGWSSGCLTLFLYSGSFGTFIAVYSQPTNPGSFG